MKNKHKSTKLVSASVDNVLDLTHDTRTETIIDAFRKIHNVKSKSHA